MKALKQHIANMKRDVMTLYFAMRHPKTPLLAKIVIVLVVSYALSPIDLIPDFIPIIGYLDDILIVGLGVFIVIKLLPKDVIADCAKQAENWFIEHKQKPNSYIGAAIVVLIWLSFLWLCWIYIGERA